MQKILKYQQACRKAVPGGRGGGGGHVPLQFLADQLILSQQGGQIMPTTLLRALPDFLPFDGPDQYSVSVSSFLEKIVKKQANPEDLKN